MNDSQLHNVSHCAVKNRVSRAGLSTVEYIVVSTMVIMLSIGGVALLGESSECMLTMSAALGESSSLPSDFAAANQFASETGSNPINELEVDPNLSRLYANTQRFQIFSTISLVFVVGLGFMYLRQGRKLNRNQEENTCKVELLRQRSIALEKVLNKRKHVLNAIRDDWSQFSGENCQVGKFMSTEVVTVEPNLPIKEANTLLNENGYRRVIVVDKNGDLKGVLSKKDIKTKSGEIVADIMTDKPKTTTPEMEVQIALTVLLQNRISCLPVVENEKLVGLLSTSDLLVLLQCLLASLNEQLMQPAELCLTR